MIAWPKIMSLALVCGAAMLVGFSPELRAATSSLEVLPADRADDGAESVDVGGLKPLARPARESAAPLQSGNPLWAVPLSMLAVTQARPIFSASRRPPQRAVVAPAAQPAVKPPAPAQPEHLALALIGAVVGDGDAIAVLLDQATQQIVRLRQGDSHAGWQLSAVQGREVTFKKAGHSDEVLAMPRQQAPAPGGSGPVMPLPQPVAGARDGSSALLTPRSMPKHRGPNGL
jgi:general secretion pathway protein N